MNRFWPWWAFQSWVGAFRMARWTYREQAVTGIGWLEFPFDVCREVRAMHQVSRDFARESESE